MASLTEAIGVKEAKWVTIIGCALLSSIGGTYIWLHTYMKYPSYRKEDTKNFFKSIGEIKSALTNPDVTRLNEIKLISSDTMSSQCNDATQNQSKSDSSTQNNPESGNSLQNQLKTEDHTSDFTQNKPKSSEKTEDINSYNALSLELFE